MAQCWQSQLIDEAEALIRSGKLYPLHRSLLRSSIERARSGDASDLAGRLAETKARVARQDAANAAEADLREAERDRLAREVARRFGTPGRVRRELGRIEADRDRRARAGDCPGWGLSYDPGGKDFERREVLRRALAIIETGATT